MSTDPIETTYCTVHPDRETSLRCNRCGRYMCASCAVPTPVGYSCRECIRQQDNRYFTAGQRDYVVIFAACAAFSLPGAVLMSAMGFWFLGFFVGAAAGGLIGTWVRRMIGRRRGRYASEVAAGGVLLGAALAPSLLVLLRAGVLIFVPPFSIGLLVYAGAAAFVVYNLFKGRI